jgi:hypothetical protein
MRIDLTDFRNALDNLMTDLKSIYQEKITEAETAKEIINEQIEVLNGVSDDMFDISEMMSDFATAFDETADTFDSFGVRVADVAQGLIDAGVPEGNIGTFIGFCSVCGEELHIEDRPYLRPDSEQLVCVNCNAKYDENEDEDDEPKFSGAPAPVDND